MTTYMIADGDEDFARMVDFALRRELADPHSQSTIPLIGSVAEFKETLRQRVPLEALQELEHIVIITGFQFRDGKGSEIIEDVYHYIPQESHKKVHIMLLCGTPKEDADVSATLAAYPSVHYVSKTGSGSPITYIAQFLNGLDPNKD